ncbi:probable ubiquitin-conjugating enzyme E2 24 [Salvia miltiorrhiza]|uniref:probable ubiquitin-conjugating enzyme E2 24 n=1 Tax=Salvia miltiorrhiza TaxID=226208 RepID=UPI0025AC3A67|nr:probable ubiquitin-conjugating enzyme E2 24 [Salvia miltiorrhiza]
MRPSLSRWCCHNGLFFLDIYLPPNYPNLPPQVHYHSHDNCLNPNLYANGVVCLSWINIWSGTKAEKWTNGSNILQLLMSIQSLVLNSSPFFNEPIYKLWKDNKLSTWIKSSNHYNEDAFILSCKNMKKVINHPSQNFGEFVVEHFRQRVAPLIAAIDGYHQGLVSVDQLGMTSASSSCHALRISSKFKSNLKRIRGHLESAFASRSIPVPSKPRALSRVSSKPRAPSKDKSEKKYK